jgi:hypothetical protein
MSDEISTHPPAGGSRAAGPMGLGRADAWDGEAPCLDCGEPLAHHCGASDWRGMLDGRPWCPKYIPSCREHDMALNADGQCPRCQMEAPR